MQDLIDQIKYQQNTYVQQLQDIDCPLCIKNDPLKFIPCKCDITATNIYKSYNKSLNDILIKWSKLITTKNITPSQSLQIAQQGLDPWIFINKNLQAINKFEIYKNLCLLSSDEIILLLSYYEYQLVRDKLNKVTDKNSLFLLTLLINQITLKDPSFAEKIKIMYDSCFNSNIFYFESALFFVLNPCDFILTPSNNKLNSSNNKLTYSNEIDILN